jgi:hypothetical protein
MAPDARLAAKATDTCRPADQALPMQVVLQDRRTEFTAAFLLAAPGWTGSCLTSLVGGGGGSGWRSGVREAMTASIAIDEQSSGDLDEGTANLLGGRTAPNVVAVKVQLDNAVVVNASVSSGHWLAWWPGGVAAAKITVTALDGGVTVIEWRDGGWAF